MSNLHSTVYTISHPFFFGGGGGETKLSRIIAESFAESFAKILAKLHELEISTKLQHCSQLMKTYMWKPYD